MGALRLGCQLLNRLAMQSAIGRPLELSLIYGGVMMKEVSRGLDPAPLQDRVRDCQMLHRLQTREVCHLELHHRRELRARSVTFAMESTRASVGGKQEDVSTVGRLTIELEIVQLQ